MRYSLLLLVAACGSSAPAPNPATAPLLHRSATTCAANPPDQNLHDMCSSDGDCSAGQVCACQSKVIASVINVCVSSGCTVDTDCSEGAVCSPTVSPGCGAFRGVQGYYCHSAKDACGNDSDCIEEPLGYCAYDWTAKRWGCYYTSCAG